MNGQYDGDDGFTTLRGREGRIPKYDYAIELLGGIEELSAWISRVDDRKSSIFTSIRSALSKLADQVETGQLRDFSREMGKLEEAIGDIDRLVWERPEKSDGEIAAAIARRVERHFALVGAINEGKVLINVTRSVPLLNRISKFLRLL